MKKILLLSLLLCNLITNSYAFYFDESRHTIKLGGTSNTGNSDTTTITGSLTNELEYKKWSYDSSLDGQWSKSDGEESARSLKTNAEINYVLSPLTFSFLRGSILYDKYDTYDFIIRESIGFGRILFENKIKRLSIQTGPGFIHRRVAGLSYFQNRPFLNISSKYRWLLSKNTKFTQNFTSDIDSVTTHLEATSLLTTAMLKDIALELSFTIRHDTQIPALSDNQKKTDTSTKITLVYSFK